MVNIAVRDRNTHAVSSFHGPRESLNCPTFCVKCINSAILLRQADGKLLLRWDQKPATPMRWCLRATAGTAIARLSHRNSVCLSVRLSVTRVDQAKTVQARIIKPSPSAAPKTLVAGSATLFQKFHRGHPNRGPEMRGGRKFCDFEPIAGHISETVRDRAKVTINH